MLFSLEVLPAAEGDCLILHWGEHRSLALIDGGPSSIYDGLRQRLLALRHALGVERLTLELVMVSHVDNDHIVGVAKLFQTLRREQEDARPLNQRPLKVERLWHNTFTDILGDKIDGYFGGQTLAALAAAAASADVSVLAAALEAVDVTGLDEHEAIDLALVLAGHAEGRGLRDDHAVLYEAGEIQRLNAPFAKAGKAVPIQGCTPHKPVALKGLSIHVVGPSVQELERLKRDLDTYLVDKGLAAPAALAAVMRKDSSPTNLSSIVCIIEYGGKRILLTGDARADRILRGLDEAGLLTDGKIQVDVLKVPHHGSARNSSPEFFEAIEARTYVVSADGKHENPDRQTVEWLIASRPRDAVYKIVFTYPLETIDRTRKALRVADNKPWDEATDAVANLLADHKSQGYAFDWTEGAFTVNLGDEAVTW